MKELTLALRGMRLVSAELHGYRRFAESTKIDLYGRLIAIVGPNEAGKSSILRALDQSDSNDPIPPEDLTRRSEVGPNQVVVKLRWLIEPDDRAAIAHLHSGTDPKRAYWLVVSKQADGVITTEVEPRLVRDLGPRHQLAERLDDARQTEGWMAEVETQDTAADPKRLGRLIEALTSPAGQLLPEIIADVQQLAALLRDQNGDEDLAKDLDALVEHESQPHPNSEARKILYDRTPDFLTFGEQERALDSQYDLNVVEADPPAALGNLAELVDLDLGDLHSTIARNDTGDVVRILSDANARLAEAFKAWTQYPIEVRFDNDGAVLRIHVSTLGGGYSQLGERSDGLKQFVALIALTAAKPRSISPILLIDEAESHLHYDAQADLMQVFARQDAAAQIIYTTHSAGCLPEDLGAGIRIVEPLQASNHSRVLNRFWSGEPGLSPLLLGMGAATLAFVPVRNAVITEGPSELVLLPTLLREATGRVAMGYQIAPGASNVKPASVAGLDLQAPRTAWLVDGDRSGAQLRKKLTKAGIPRDRIVTLGEGHEAGLVLEDLIEPDVYLWAVNEELRLRTNGIADELTPEELPKVNRPAAVDAWCDAKGYEPPGKINIANHIIEQRIGQSIIEPARKAVLLSLDKAIMEAISRDTP
jgi:predicted ATP-dependent endonuclease of OLD family